MLKPGTGEFVKIGLPGLFYLVFAVRSLYDVDIPKFWTFRLADDQTGWN
jgi:hypothetical protein